MHGPEISAAGDSRKDRHGCGTGRTPATPHRDQADRERTLTEDINWRLVMTRASWFDEKAEHPAIQERVMKLASFTSALADGVVSKQEVDDQEQRLAAAM